MEEQRAQQEAEAKAAESDVDDRYANGGEDDGEEEASEKDGQQQYERNTVPSTHPETLPEPKGLPIHPCVFLCSVVHSCATDHHDSVRIMPDIHDPPSPSSHVPSRQGQ